MPYSAVRRCFTTIAAAALLVSPLVIALSPTYAQSIGSQTSPAQPSLLVTGTGVVAYKPDTAYVSLGVVTRGTQVAVIARENAAKTDRIIKALIKTGIAVADIRTDDYSVSPVYEEKNGKTVSSGYKVSNTVTAVVRKVASAGKTIDTALKAGANTVSGVSFGLDDPQKVKDDALAKAIADATRKAKLSAQAAGLGEIRLIELVIGDANSNDTEYQYEAKNVYAAGESTPIQGGRQTMIATVTARFGLVGTAPVITP